MTDARISARGISSAYKMFSKTFDLLDEKDIINICVSVIDKRDDTQEAVDLSIMAADVLTELNSSIFRIRDSDVKKLCEYLIDA